MGDERTEITSDSSPRMLLFPVFLHVILKNFLFGSSPLKKKEKNWGEKKNQN
jgi:hypothetical protein